MLQFFRAVSALTVSMDLIDCFWRKAAVHTQAASRFPALNLPRVRAECSATKLDFAAGDSERALQVRFRVKTP
jgi:hypothetical protein